MKVIAEAVEGIVAEHVLAKGRVEDKWKIMSREVEAR